MTSSSSIVHHYSAETAPRGVLRHALWSYRYPSLVADSRILVWHFARRALLGRFRGSAGGLLWVLVQPVFQFLVYFFVFGYLFGGKGEGGASPSVMFAVYLFAGVLLFGTIQESANQGLTAIVGNANLVKRVAFPCELLPLTPVLVAVAVYVVACGILLLFGGLTGVSALGWPMLAWPLLIVCLLVFCLGLGLILATVNVFVRDVSQLWPILSLAWFFGSPVFWPASQVRPFLEKIAPDNPYDLLFLNPAYPLLAGQRLVFGVGADLDPAMRAGYIPHSLGTVLAVGAGWAVLTFVIGYGLFMSRKHKFSDLV